VTAQSPAAKTAQISAPLSAVRYVPTLMRIQSAFEEAGIRFLDNDAGGGIGVDPRGAEALTMGAPSRRRLLSVAPFGGRLLT
jgi:hypothetical protein